MSFTTANLSRGSVTLTRGDGLGLRVIAYHGSSPTYNAVTSAPVCTWLGDYGNASITTFNVRRFKGGAASDDGTVAALDLKIATGLPAAATCKITYKESDSETFSAPISVTLTSAQAGMTANTTILSAVTLQIGTAYDFRVTVGDAYESAIKQVRVSRGIGKLNISSTAPGVAIGKLPTATTGSPKFECQYPAHFYGGITALSHAHILEMLGVQTGVTGFPSGVPQGWKDVAITFPIPYKQPPLILIFPQTGNITAANVGSNLLVLLQDTLTATGFTVRWYNDTTATRYPGARWIAIGELDN
jgi:hypothetical protein